MAEINKNVFCLYLTFKGMQDERVSIVVVVAFTMVIVMTAYTAVLTASNVRQEEIDPFKGMQDERVSIVVDVAFTMVIVMTAYTAVLTASNVRQEERDPFKYMFSVVLPSLHYHISLDSFDS